MDKPGGLLGDTLGQLGSIGKGLGQSLTSTPKDLAKTAASQVGIAALEEKEKVGLSEQLGGSSEKKKGESFATDKDRTDFLKGLYGLSSKEPQNPRLPSPTSEANGGQAQSPQQSQNPSEAPKTPQEQAQMAQAQQKIEALRQQQHKSEYYDPTFNRPKPQEEHQAEKVEREKEEDERKKLQVSQKKKEKPMAVQMGAERAEKFRGVSG